jgi:membrane-bound lytic murein transglycosylase B
VVTPAGAPSLKNVKLSVLFCLASLLAAAALNAAAGMRTPHNKPAKHRSVVAQPAGPLYASRADALQAADEIAEQYGLDRDWVRQAIGQSRFVAAVVRLSTPAPAGVAKNWTAYRSRFVEPVRIEAGVKFWRANREALEAAEAQTGVPASIVVGILGVETLYGQHTGNFRVMDALCTLAFDFPQAHPRAAARTAFFRSELAEFLLLTSRTHTDPLALRGSYAGAMGLPQFMPSSWNRYAVDFDGDGHIDLFHSSSDVIGSVANYFRAFDWQRGLPTHYPVQISDPQADRSTLLAPDILPTFSPQDMAALGVQVDTGSTAPAGPLSLVELQNGPDAPTYVAGTANFYALTRYNWSSYYALAVVELGQAVAARLSN